MPVLKVKYSANTRKYLHTKGLKTLHSQPQQCLLTGGWPSKRHGPFTQDSSLFKQEAQFFLRNQHADGTKRRLLPRDLGPLLALERLFPVRLRRGLHHSQSPSSQTQQFNAAGTRPFFVAKINGQLSFVEWSPLSTKPKWHCPLRQTMK